MSEFPRQSQMINRCGHLALAAGIGLLATLASAGGSEGWTRFRGPNGTGRSQAETIPTEWSKGDHVWKTELPGIGHSSPVIWGEKVFLTSTKEGSGRLFLLCLDAESGDQLWKETISFIPYRQHPDNSFAAATPAVDGERVYLCWSTATSYMLAGFDHDGTKVWQRDFGPFVSDHGSGASPIVYNDKVILANDQQEEGSLIAVDAATGDTVWEVTREVPREGGKVAYSTPCVLHSDDGEAALIFTSKDHGISAIDPKNGEVKWEKNGNLFTQRTVSSPVLADGLVIGTCGRGGSGESAVAVRPGNEETGREPKLAWRKRKAVPYVPTGVSVNNLLFLWSDSGFVTCIEPRSGKVHWSKRVDGSYYGSPIAVEGRLYCISRQGEVVVLEASKEFNLLARNSLGEKTQTTPAVANGKMYIRTLKHLLCIGGEDSSVDGS